MTIVSPNLDASPSMIRNDHLFRLLAAAIAVLAILVRAWMSWHTHFTGEDAMITLRYAENLAHGRGFVYNPGAHILGTTTPLYTLLLALFAWLHADAMTLGKACNILAEGLTCFLLARMLARPDIRQPVAGLFAALFYAFSSLPITISISGMETGLVTCAGVGAITAYLERRAIPLYVLGALLFLLRIDGLLLFAFLAVTLALQTRNIPWAAMGWCLLLVLPWLAFSFAYFGSPVPNSFCAKLAVYGHQQEAPVVMMTASNHADFFRLFAQNWMQRGILALFVLGAATVFSPQRTQGREAPRGENRDLLSSSLVFRVTLVWLLAYYGTMFTSHVMMFGWYFLPPFPLYACVAALGGARLLVWLTQYRPEWWTPPRRTLAWRAALAIFMAAGVIRLPATRREIAATQQLNDQFFQPIGEWLGTHVRPGERILVESIGYIGYYSHQDILDEIGLVSPEILSSYRTGRPLQDIVKRLRPEWLCLRKDEEATLQASPTDRFEIEYRRVGLFAIPNVVPYAIYHRADLESFHHPGATYPTPGLPDHAPRLRRGGSAG
jgi:hypothetical protein